MVGVKFDRTDEIFAGKSWKFMDVWDFLNIELNCQCTMFESMDKLARIN